MRYKEALIDVDEGNEMKNESKGPAMMKAGQLLEEIAFDCHEIPGLVADGQRDGMKSAAVDILDKIKAIAEVLELEVELDEVSEEEAERQYREAGGEC